MSSLSDAQKIKGVIASSAGNHAQGVALAAKKLKIRAVIVMPNSTPKIKVQAVQQLGAEVILYGDVYDDAFQYANKLCSEQELNFIHPYDYIDVIAGQATVAKEILSQLKDVDLIFVPVGGGGLISGIASYIKHYAPKVKVIGVEPIDSATLHNALEENVSSVRLLGSFRLVLADGTEDPEELGSSTISAIDLAGLEPGSTTAAFVMQSGLGYTGTQPRLELMEHRLFQDAKLSLFAKHRSDPWVKLGEYMIDRTLLIRGSLEN